MTSLAPFLRKARRTVLARRRLLAALLAGGAVAASVGAVAGPPPSTTTVLTAARDLPAGRVLGRADLRATEFAPDSVPSGTLALADLVGRTTAGPLRRGEPVTDVAVVRGTLLDGYPGLVAVPVRVADADAAELLDVGDRVDLVAADPQGSAAAVVADRVPIVALPGTGAESRLGGVAGSSGRLVVVAAPEETALEVADASVSRVITVVLRR